MCGRYTLSVVEGFEDFYEINERVSLEPRYNIAPTQDIPVITREAGGCRSLHMMHWGLLPSWSDGPGENPARMINARSETVDTKVPFRDAFKTRRCLIPADGFYEWQKQGRKKLPIHFSLLEGGLFAFAGLWEVWRRSGQEALSSSTILTTEANALVAPVHDRMPAMLLRERFPVWLDPETPPTVLKGLLSPFPAGLMRCRRVNPRVNKASAEGPELLEDPQHWQQPGLFSR